MSACRAVPKDVVRARRFSRALRAGTAGLALGLWGGLAGAQSTDEFPEWIARAHATRIGDPKLDGGGFDVEVGLAQDAAARVRVDVLDAGGSPVRRLFAGRVGGGTPIHLRWDGLDALGAMVAPASYTVRVVAARGGRSDQVDLPVDVVRLGFVSLAAESVGAEQEWQMVYFRKDGAYEFYATPATGEYVCTADTGEIAELDLDDGSPRPAPALHGATDEPALEPDGGGGMQYEDDSFNYPLCFESGAEPVFVATFGSTCTDGSGVAHGVNYPVAGYDLRMVGRDSQGGEWSTDDLSITPGGTERITGPALTALQTRTDLDLEWRFQYRDANGGSWIDVPGRTATQHRIFTQLSFPRFGVDSGETQYAGPWVEVSDYQYRWAQGLGITCDTSEAVVESVIKGFFGQVGPFSTAIEDVHYDCPSQGGDGGATHYYNFNNNTVSLSRLLNQHDNGKYVNCSDCASSTSTMLGMLGVRRMRMMRLGSMTLRAIWGIGTADYTIDLWSNGGGSGHGFSYHHIITRDGGENCSDACLCVDEDGNPNALPGTPGWNHDRPWDDYEALVAKANVTWQIDPLPKLR